jgi:hypothetical protein
MTKAPFRMPRRTESPTTNLDQWVSGSEAGAENRATAARQGRPAGKVARLTIDLTSELHAKFKATCAIRGTRMIDEVRRLIEDWTQKNG